MAPARTGTVSQTQFNQLIAFFRVSSFGFPKFRYYNIIPERKTCVVFELFPSVENSFLGDLWKEGKPSGFNPKLIFNIAGLIERTKMGNIFF